MRFIFMLFILTLTLSGIFAEDDPDWIYDEPNSSREKINNLLIESQSSTTIELGLELLSDQMSTPGKLPNPSTSAELLYSILVPQKYRTDEASNSITIELKMKALELLNQTAGSTPYLLSLLSERIDLFLKAQTLDILSRRNYIPDEIFFKKLDQVFVELNSSNHIDETAYTIMLSIEKFAEKYPIDMKTDSLIQNLFSVYSGSYSRKTRRKAEEIIEFLLDL